MKLITELQLGDGVDNEVQKQKENIVTVRRVQINQEKRRERIIKLENYQRKVRQKLNYLKKAA